MIADGLSAPLHPGAERYYVSEAGSSDAHRAAPLADARAAYSFEAFCGFNPRVKIP